MEGKFPLELYTYVLKTITDIALNLNFKPKNYDELKQLLHLTFYEEKKQLLMRVYQNSVLIELCYLKNYIFYETCFTYLLSNPRLL